MPSVAPRKGPLEDQVANLSLSLSLSLLISGVAQGQHPWELKGTWDTASSASDTLAIHMTLLPASTPEGCKVLVFNRSLGTEQNPNPPFRVRSMSSGGTFNYDSYTTVTFETGSGTNYHELFCAGHAFTADGKLFLAGGHGHIGEHGDSPGIVHTYLFDPAAPPTDAFIRKSDMWEGRWYPTVLPMPDRQMLIVGGTFGAFQPNFNPSLWIGSIPESGNPDHQAQLPAQVTTAYYPHIFIDPKTGRPFHTPHGYYSANEQTFYDGLNLVYDPVASSWTSSGVPQFASGTNVERTYPSAIMVDGVVVKCGGAKHLDGPDDAVKRTLFIDLNSATPAWVVGPLMNAGRMNHTLVGLPDGKVVAFNGSNDSQWDGPDQQEIDERVQPEMFDTKADPAQGWIKLALPGSAGLIPRGYHSTALLTPDATVLIGGGEPFDPEGSASNRLKRQIFTPPYAGTDSWKGTRPAISSAPAEIRHGTSFEIGFAAGAIGRTPSVVTLISLGSTTHGFNQNQTINTLPFTVSGSTVTVTWQTRHLYMVPGPYMLFVVDDTGRPSVAKIVTLKDRWDRTLIDSGSLSNGSFFIGWTFPRQLALGDNIYLGGHMESNIFAPSMALTMNCTVPLEDNAKFAVYAEFQVDRALDYYVDAWNFDTDQYVQIAEGETTSGVEIGVDAAVDDASRQPYVDSTNNQVQVRLRWQDTIGGFKVQLDRVEVRTR